MLAQHPVFIQRPRPMQDMFGFAGTDMARWAALLEARFGRPVGPARRRPVGQLVKSLISARTRDEVSMAAYRRLGARWPRARDLADASPAEIAQVIADVTFADRKAEQLPAALRAIRAARGDLDLDWLAGLTVADAVAWLERLPGVGNHVATKTLAASTLHMRVFIVDTHVARVLVRLGVVGPTATTGTASARVTASTPFLDAEGLLQLFAQTKLLGQTICRFDAPDCAACPLSHTCPTAKAMDAPPRHA